MTAAQVIAYQSIPRGAPDVDWIFDDNLDPVYHGLVNASKYRAACGQRLGVQLPEGEECQRCERGPNPFASCRVAVLKDGKALFQGACMNCGWSQQGSSCRVREDPPESVRGYLPEGSNQPPSTPKTSRTGSSNAPASVAPSTKRKAKSTGLASIEEASPSKSKAPSSKSTPATKRPVTPASFDSVTNAIGRDVGLELNEFGKA